MVNFVFKGGSTRSIKAKKNIILAFMANIITITISFIYVPLLIEHLDAERYGIWLTITSIAGWFSFFDGGIGNGLKNNLVGALAKKDIVLAREYISTTYAFVAIVFISFLFIFYMFNFFLKWKNILNIDLVSENELKSLMCVVTTFFSLGFILRIIDIITEANQEAAIGKFIVPISNIISLISILILVNFGKSNLVIFGFVITFSPVLVLLFTTIYLFRGRYSQIRPSFHLIKRKHVKLLSQLGGKFMFVQLSSLILFSLSNFLIIRFVGPKEVSQYNIALKYFQIPTMIYAIIMTPIWAATTDAYLKEDTLWLKNTMKKLNILSVTFVIGIIFMFFLSDAVYEFWLKNQIEIPYILNITMMFYAITTVFLSPYSQYINGFGKLNLSSRIAIFKVLLYIPLSIVLLKSNIGASGVMLTTILFSILSAPFYIVQVNRLIKGTAKNIWAK